ncbi:MAG: CHAD domain-containing protein [Sulfuricurvum sp.]|jgi:CHAD domain-containing protein|uniref:CHAD domain-containing protein n=1 Tax=Sulfuricurvum sp. TaxID=2025608 RepID=UPI0025D00F6B|nr:CHAD domain-containing protein [Sulfuricurvum sp.]MCK9373440.1 CHAD domain-containing protein [Sulfuricurvum sp.]
MERSLLTEYLSDQLKSALGLLRKIEGDGEPDDIHQFRVSIRRIRSLLRLYGEDIPPFPVEIKQFVQKTNSVREIDVLLSLIRPDKYPKTFKRLRNLRKKQYRLSFDPTALQKITVLVQHYDEKLSRSDPKSEPLRWIALAETNYRIARIGYQSLSKKTPQKELHALRIRFKIARYALEFIDKSGLKGENEKIAECKVLQERLGAVQDTFNQLIWLKKIYRKKLIDEIRTLTRKREKSIKKLKKLEFPLNR